MNWKKKLYCTKKINIHYFKLSISTWGSIKLWFPSLEFMEFLRISNESQTHLKKNTIAWQKTIYCLIIKLHLWTMTKNCDVSNAEITNFYENKRKNIISTFRRKLIILLFVHEKIRILKPIGIQRLKKKKNIEKRSTNDCMKKGQQIVGRKIDFSCLLSAIEKIIFLC